MPSKIPPPRIVIVDGETAGRRGRRAGADAAIVGSSPGILRVMEIVERVAVTDATVLVLGESGTGKELVARAVHERSPRRKRPMFSVDCGALAESVLESELFGHTRGAFTGAVADRVGLFEEAHGSTLFLDEVGELPLATQTRLLRALQEGLVRRVGSNAEREVDVRVVAATNRNLAREVKAGRFRGDLYYRLNVMPVHLPPLRERRDDIPTLARHLLARRGEKLGKVITRVTPGAMDALVAYAWPGNVRELENVLERAVVLAPGTELTARLVLEALRFDPQAGSLPPAAPSVPPAPSVSPPPLAQAKASFEREYLRRVLALAGGSVTEGARLAGLDRANFRRLLKRHGLRG